MGVMASLALPVGMGLLVKGSCDDEGDSEVGVRKSDFVSRAKKKIKSLSYLSLSLSFSAGDDFKNSVRTESESLSASRMTYFKTNELTCELSGCGDGCAS